MLLYKLTDEIPDRIRLDDPHLPHQIAGIQFLADAGLELVVADQLVAGEFDFEAVVEHCGGMMGGRNDGGTE